MAASYACAPMCKPILFGYAHLYVLRVTFSVVTSNVEAFLSEVARGLKPRADQLTAGVVDLVRSELPELWKYEDLATAVPVAVSGHVIAVLDLNEHSLDVTKVEALPAAIDVARRFARHGVPINKLLRSYRIGHAGLLQLICDEAAHLTSDTELVSATVITLGAQSFEYIDRTSEQAVMAYQEERDRWLQRRLILINEAGARIGTTLDITETAQELANVSTDRFADLAIVDLLDSAFQEAGVEPAPVSPVLRRVAQHSVWDGFPESEGGTGQKHTYPEESDPARALATGQPQRLRTTTSDIPGWVDVSPDYGRTLRTFGVHSILLVPLQARGNTLGLAQFLRHRTTDPFDDDDLLLANEIASRAAVSIDNARRYTHERFTALTLQRSLLQQQSPEQPAVETACRYLPCGSRAGVGGDWYDVIPLSGARVALVVGDVVGHGLHASVTMGRLRTAVRAFADIDLIPDELLTHLDDVVIRLEREEAQGTHEISATCLYAVYDPVSRLCSLASAGHVLPAVVTPSTSSGDAPTSCDVDFPQLPIGPPLGLGGLPFETAQFEVPEGSLLVLYTDGLIEDRARGVDTGLGLLREVLARAPTSLEDTCDRVLSSLLPSRPSDDVALLIARTRTLDSGQVATWDLVPDPAIVSETRRHASEQLSAWGLEDLAFTTELMVSELVTNAIRYGKPPIRLRMIRHTTLTCEVSDNSSTAPHLRRARSFDENGRGLLLVAQLAGNWGTRHTREGKVIWAEQQLPAIGIPLPHL
ncbi:SpoIIE family protein phosphatase [Streptomyces sp. MBT62]|uniref:ATP-binding SpoIIE family protein phosphatase n=1 Tax=Streptomyces sp. MBT62 TaxID=2800410 RepID=UPI001F176B1B|nr:SpoIIE family protein phosphatase [Streptomyces sp. MBT62]